MTMIKVLHFGPLDPASLEEYYDVEIDYHSARIQIDLNFNGNTIEAIRLEVVKGFIENIRIHDLNNKKYIARNFDDVADDTVRSYIEHHLEELATDDLEELIGKDTRSADRPKLLLKQLHLVRVGIYPDSADEFATFDYSLGRELTNDLVVVFTDENGNLDYMTVES